jgi:hypothetical protein
MRNRGHVYHRLLVLVLVLVLVVVLPVRDHSGSGSGHPVVGRLWLESSRGRGVKDIRRRVC